MAVVAEDNGAETGWRAVFAEMFVGARAAAQRFPVTTLFLLAAAVQANLMAADVHVLPESKVGSDPNFSLLMGFLAGAMASLAAALSGEARGHSALAKVAVALAAGAAAGLVVSLPERFMAQPWVLEVALAGLVPLAPFVWRGGGAPFWMFTARTAFAVVLGVLALLLFAGGISAILASLTYLFGFEIADQLYEHVWFATGLFAAPLFGLGQLPERFDEQPGEFTNGFMDRGMRALGDFVAAPLLILYAVILHLYALKIVISRDVPEGQIGWLVLIYGLCIFGALLVINPFFDRARAPTRAFLRLWPFFLPVPLVLLFYALALRIVEYGVTPERFLLGLFGIVTVVILVLQFFPRLRGDIRVFAGLPIAAVILTGFGPQGALGFSLASQADRFLAIVENPPVSEEGESQALSALSFLSRHEATARVLPEGTDISPDNAYMETAKAWNLDPSRSSRDAGIVQLNVETPMAFATDGFDIAIGDLYLDSGNREPVSVPLPSGEEVAFALADDALTVTVGERSVSFPIAVDKLRALSKRPEDVPAELRLESEGRRLKLVPHSLDADPAQKPSLTGIITIVLMRADDWR